MIRELRQKGASEAVMRALLVEGWLELLAHPAQQAASVEGVLLRLPMEERMLFASSRLQALAHAAPQQFVEEMTTMPPLTSAKLAQESLAGYAAMDPARALSLAQRLTASGMQVTTGDIFRQWGIKDSSAALAKAMSLQGEGARGAAISSIHFGMLIGDSVKAYAALSDLPAVGMVYFDSSMLYHHKHEIVQSLAADDGNAKIAMSLALKPLGMTRDIFSALAETQPDKIKNEVTKLLASDGFAHWMTSDRTVAGMVQGLSAADPESARTFVVDVLKNYRPPKFMGANRARAALAEGLAAKGGETGFLVAQQSLKEGSQPARMLGTSIMAELAMRDGETLEEAVGMVPKSIPSSYKDSAIAKILIQSELGTDFSQAASLVKEIQSSEVRKMAFDSIITNWLDVDAQATLNWAGLHEKDYPGVTGIAMQAWASSDPHGASEAIAALPAGPGRDAYIPALVQSIATSDSNSAIAWAASASDAALRQEMVFMIVSRMKGSRRSLDTLLQAEGLDAATASFIRQEWAKNP